MSLRVKRVYDEPAKSDGYRVLVDRLWPRGLTKSAAAIDEWMKEIAPSSGLRKTFRHEPVRWNDFKKEYWEELHGRGLQLQKLVDMAKRRRVTLLFAAKDTEHNNAVALKELIEHRF